jgi:hypothetical protein
MNLSTPTAAIVLALLTPTAVAQTAFVLNRDPSTGLKPEFAAWLPNLAAPAGIGLIPSFLRPDLPNYYAASLLATGTPLAPVANEGGIAIDQEAKLVYATDGSSFLTQDAHAVYGAVATAPMATLPLTGWAGGDITGLAVSSAPGILYICDGFTCQLRSKTHPYPVLAPAFPMPPFAGVPGATGLDYDPATGTLWACNVDGATIEFTTGGALIGAHPAPPVPGIGPVRGIAINTTAGPFALPPLPGQTPGFHVCLTDGSKVYDALPPYGSITLSSSFPTHCRGLAISNDPVLYPGAIVGGFPRFNNDPALNPGPGFLYPQTGLSLPACKYLFGPAYVTLDGAPPGAGVALIGDLIPLGSAGGGITIGPDVLWLNPFSPFFFTVGTGADGTGHAQLELPMAGLPIGLQVAMQWLVPDGSAYLGVDFSDALLFRIGLR